MKFCARIKEVEVGQTAHKKEISHGYAKKCPQKPKFDGHRFDFLSIIPKVYYSFEHIMLKSSIVFNENVQKFDLHDSNFEPNWMKSTKLLFFL